MKAQYFKNNEDYPWDDKSLMYMIEVEVALCDSEMAASLLDVAASYLENKRVMPDCLATYFAKALREAASTNEKDSKTTGQAQRDALGLMLNLTTARRRPKTTSKIVGEYMKETIQEEANAVLFGKHVDRKRNISSEALALKYVAKELRISETTAKEHWYEWQAENSDYYEFLSALLRIMKKKAK